MNIMYKPILFENGTVRPIPGSLFNELFDGSATLSGHSGQSMNCALAFISGPQQGIYTLTCLQCIRINFNEHGAPATWHMSLFELESPCALVKGNTPRPLKMRRRQEPHFWFPDRDELALIARALTEQYAPSEPQLRIKKRILQSGPGALPPVIPQPQDQRPAAH